MRWLLLTTCIALLLAAPLRADGPKELIENNAEEPSLKLEPISATAIGGSGVEQVAGAGFTRDGDVILFLNSWGPDLPQLVDADDITIFAEKHSSFDPRQPVYLEREPGVHGARLNHENTNVSGVVLHCNRDMSEVKRILAFGFGVARFGQAGVCRVAPDGGLIITGRGQASFAQLAPQAPARSLAEERRERVDYYEALRVERERVRQAGTRLPELPPGKERVEQEIVDAQGRVLYLARVAADLTTLEWALLMDETSRAPNPAVDYRFDQQGWIVFAERGALRRLSPDGKQLQTLPVRLRDGIDAWGVNPVGGDVYVAERFRSDTGRAGESYDSPALSAGSPRGEPRWRAWGWSGILVGLERYRLLAPARIAAVHPHGETLIALCQHDSVNSVLARDPVDLDEALPSAASPLITSLFPWRDAPSANLLVEMNATSRDVVRWTYWSAFFPDESRPWGHRARRASAIEIASVQPLGDAGLLLTGRSDTGLAETKHAWVRVSPRQEYAGAYVSVLDRDWAKLRFSTYIPAVEEAHAVAQGDRALLFGDTRERDELGQPPLERPLQKLFGGAIDAWFALIELPSGGAP